MLLYPTFLKIHFHTTDHFQVNFFLTCGNRFMIQDFQPQLINLCHVSEFVQNKRFFKEIGFIICNENFVFRENANYELFYNGLGTFNKK